MTRVGLKRDRVKADGNCGKGRGEVYKNTHVGKGVNAGFFVSLLANTLCQKLL